MLFRAAADETFQLSPIKAIELAAAKIPGAISLAQGIPSFETPPIIKEFVKEKIDAGVCDKYSLTSGLTELREEIALSLAADGMAYDPDTEIIVTAGSIEGISASILGSTDPGDEVLIPSPSYASYGGAISLARCTPRYFELDEDRNFDFQLSRFEQAITRRTRAVLFSSPNNPTGTLFSEELTRGLVDIAMRHNLTVIVDEAYKDFYYTDDRHFTPVLIPEARRHVIRVCTFSKAFAMTGWRVGFLHGDRSRVQQLLKYHDALVTCAPVVSQYGAIAALRYGQPYLEKYREEYRQRRDYVVSALDGLSNALDYQTPKASYFVFPRVKDTIPLARDSQRLAYDILERTKVALVPGVAFGPSGEGHLRITFGRRKEDLEEGMARLAEYFQGARAHAAAPRGARTVSSLMKVPKRGALARLVLGGAARAYLARTRPIVIAIAGSRGKTVFKRTLSEALSPAFRVRSTILSYNTAVGLPLSVLGLELPRGTAERMAFPLRVAQSALAGSASEILLLEYGIDTESEAKALLAIAPPSWVVLTSATIEEPGIDREELARGLGALVCAVPSERRLWSADSEPHPLLAPHLPESGRIEPVASHPSPTVGRSALYAAACADKLRILVPKAAAPHPSR